MQKWSRVLILTFTIFSTTSSFSHWIESYYDCLCYSGSKTECLNKVENDYPDSKDYVLLSISNPESVHLLTQIRAAQIILEQRYISRPEESACLLPAKTQITNTLAFSLKENSDRTPGSKVYIKALHELGREIYQWAEDNCFDQKGNPHVSLRVELPNPAFCKKYH